MKATLKDMCRLDDIENGLKNNAEAHRNYKLYTSMGNALGIILTGHLYISNGENWNDVPDRNQMQEKDSFGLCFSCSTVENIAMWML